MLALALLATGIVLRAPNLAVVTLTAAPAGHISPEGEVRIAVGDTLTVTAWSDDQDLDAWLTVDGQSVRPTRGADGRSSYNVTVATDVGIQASFIQLATDVRVFPSRTTAASITVSAAQDEVIIAGAPDFVASLHVDDVVTNTAGTGYPGRLTARILGIEHDGERTVLRTEPVPFTAAIVKGSIRADIPLRFTTDAQGRPVSMISTSVARAGEISRGGFTLGLDRTFHGEGDYSTADAVVHGSVSMDLVLDIKIDIAPKTCLCWPPVAGEIRLFEITLTELATATAKLAVDARLRLAQAAQILEHGFPGTFISVIYVEPDVKIGVGIDVATEGSLDVRASATERVRVGIRYEDGGWSSISEYTSDATGSTDVGATARARVYPTIRFGATIERACTPYIEFQPGFVELSADADASPWWYLDTGITGAAGIDCDLLVTKLQWRVDDHELARVRIGDAGGPLVAAAPQGGAVPSGPPSSPITVAPTLAPTDPPNAHPTATLATTAFGHVAFLRGDANFGEVLPAALWTVDTVGGAARQVPIAVDRVSDFEWSPDGQRIAITGVTGNGSGLWVGPVSGPFKQVGDGASAVSWSPDGRHLAYIGAGAVFTVSAAGGDPIRVATSNSQEIQWSPDGKRLLTAGRGLTVMEPDGSGQILLEPSPDSGADMSWADVWWLEDASWSPDSHQIVAHGCSPAGCNPMIGSTYVYTLGGSIVEVPDDGHGAFFPAWSPKGDQILMSSVWHVSGSGSQEGEALVLPAASAAGELSLVHDPGYDSDWARAGIVVQTSEGLLLLEGDNREPRQLTRDPSDRRPEWQPRP